jgi:hypothetical protein
MVTNEAIHLLTEPKMPVQHKLKGQLPFWCNWHSITSIPNPPSIPHTTHRPNILVKCAHIHSLYVHYIERHSAFNPTTYTFVVNKHTTNVTHPPINNAILIHLIVLFSYHIPNHTHTFLALGLAPAFNKMPMTSVCPSLAA